MVQPGKGGVSRADAEDGKLSMMTGHGTFDALSPAPKTPAPEIPFPVMGKEKGGPTANDLGFAISQSKGKWTENAWGKGKDSGHGKTGGKDWGKDKGKDWNTI